MQVRHCVFNYLVAHYHSTDIEMSRLVKYL